MEFFSLCEDSNNSKSFKVHAMLHLGMLDQPNEAFRLERNGFKKGYSLPDMDGKFPDNDDLTGEGEWKDLPDKLPTDVDVDRLYEEVIARCDVGISYLLLKE